MGKTRVTKEEVARILEEIGTLLELKGENPFKCNAYHNASRALGIYDGSLEQLISSGDIHGLKGIGKSIAEKILTLHKTGRLPYYEELRKSLPAGLLEMMRIPGFGPRRTKAVYELLGVKSVGELEYACRENRLVDLPGFGLKSQQKILEGIEFLKKGAGRHHINVALTAGRELVEALQEHKDVIRISICGSLRRCRETIRDIDILVSARQAGRLMEFFTRLRPVEKVEAKGETKTSVVLETGINADLRVVSDKEFPYALIYFTGSKEHNVEMRSRAKRLFDVKMNEYGLFQGAQEKFIACKDEEQIFRALELQYIPPELREATGEIQVAEKKKLPELVEDNDIKGILHMHTTYSDGTVKVSDYVKEAKKMGLQFIGITDHSKSAAYANGLTEAEIRQQHKEIDELNKQQKAVCIFKGIECDILPNGKLDYPDSVLSKFDFVIAAIHSKFNMSEEEMTGRIMKGLSNPHVTMLAHPTGRLLLARDAYPINLTRLIEFCGKNQVMIEINCHPYRLDLDWRFCKRAVEAGVILSINPDAHNVEGLHDVSYGVGIARKGWCPARSILNAYPVGEARELLGRRRGK